MSQVQVKIGNFVAIAILVLTSLLALGCSSNSKGNNSGSSSVPATSVSLITKPAPVIVSVNDTTSGMDDNYYAILIITIKNQGSGGTILINASVTQGGRTETNQMITNIDQNSTQVIDLVFPLKWQGGDWTQIVQASVP